MAFYKCPDCNFLVQNWPLLKGHLMGKHNRDDLKDVKESSAFAEYEITAEQFARLKPPVPQVATPALPAPAGTPAPPAPAGTPAPPPEPITEYVGEPVARLRQVLLVNGGAPAAAETVTRIMTLSRWLWGNPYELERTLLPHFPGKREWVQACISQYIRGVELPDDVKGMSPYNYGQPNPYAQPAYGFPYPNQPAQGPFGQPIVPPELQELRAELARLWEERQREHEQSLLTRIAELEKKAEGGGQLAMLQEKIKDLENRLTGAGQADKMTIYDEKGNPMVLPYDRSYMAALNRKQEAETEAIKTAQLIDLLKSRGDSGDKYAHSVRMCNRRNKN